LRARCLVINSISSIRPQIHDQGRRQLQDDNHARAVADKLAEELNARRPELRGKSYKVLVTNDEGSEIHLAPVAPFRLGSDA
jgi:hypothetical protein